MGVDVGAPGGRLAVTYRGRTVILEKQDLPPVRFDKYDELPFPPRRREVRDLPHAPLARKIGFVSGCSFPDGDLIFGPLPEPEWE